jgi:hypothetical protein
MIRAVAITICLTGCSLITQPRASLDPHARRPSRTPILVDVAASAVIAGLAVASADLVHPEKVGGVPLGEPIYFNPIAMGLGVLAAVFAVSAWHGTNEYCAANPDARC